MSLLENGNVRRMSVGVGGAIAAAREAFESYDRQVAAIVCQSTMLIQDSARLYEENDVLKAENKRLRELVRDYFNAPCVECHPWDEGWHGCKHCDGGDCTLATRAIELGIEVD